MGSDVSIYMTMLPSSNTYIEGEKQLGLEFGFQEIRRSTAGRPEPPMCCNIIYHVPVPRGVKYSSLGHSRGVRKGVTSGLTGDWFVNLGAGGGDALAQIGGRCSAGRCGAGGGGRGHHGHGLGGDHARHQRGPRGEFAPAKRKFTNVGCGIAAVGGKFAPNK
eukprot:1180055-Prorocentrum_minimum.AAC.1